MFLNSGKSYEFPRKDLIDAVELLIVDKDGISEKLNIKAIVLTDKTLLIKALKINYAMCCVGLVFCVLFFEDLIDAVGL